MKYAILGPQLGINRVSNVEPQHVPEQATVAEITDEQAAQVEVGRAAIPPVRYYLIEGELKTPQEKRAAAMTQSERIKAAEAHIAKYFTAFGLLEGLKKLMAAQATNNLAAIPKTVAVATWVETVKGMALAGQLNFPPTPYSFEEIVAE